MEVNPSVPVKTVVEFITYAKANPGKLNYASAGVGTAQHLCGELFKMLTGVDMVHVPYRGGAPAVADLIAGQVQAMFDLLPSSIEHVRADKLRALAVASAKPSPMLPDVPTLSVYLPSFEAGVPVGIAAPKKTSNEIVARTSPRRSAPCGPEARRAAPEAAVAADCGPNRSRSMISEHRSHRA